MTRDELLERLVSARTAFDQRVSAIPTERLDEVAPGSKHSPKDIIAHVAAYEQLIVERLIAARTGAMTSLDRDRVGWEAFNVITWSDAARRRTKDVLRQSGEVFQELLRQISELSDEELAAPVGKTAALDPAWLDGRSPGEMIAVDAFEHYPAHFAALEAAAGS